MTAVAHMPLTTDASTLVQALRAGHPGAAAAFYDEHAQHVLQTLRLPGRRGGGISLQPGEPEQVRLIHPGGLEQKEPAEKLGVSRKTTCGDLHEARRRIADALVNGKGTRIAGLPEGF